MDCSKGKPFLPNRARQSYLVEDVGGKENKAALHVSAPGKEPPFREHHGGRSGKKRREQLTDLLQNSFALEGAPAQASDAKTEDMRNVPQEVEVEMPCSAVLDAVPLSAEERSLKYSTPLRTGFEQAPTDTTTASTTVPSSIRCSAASCGNAVSAPETANHADGDTVDSVNVTKSVPQLPDKEERSPLIGPHCAVERTVSTVANSLDTRPRNGTVAPTAELQLTPVDASDSIAPQPPHHRCLDYTETTVMLAPSPNEKVPPVTTKLPCHTLASSTGPAVEKEVLAIASYVVAHPYTPEKSTQMVRHNRGVVLASDLFKKAPPATLESESTSAHDDRLAEVEEKLSAEGVSLLRVRVGAEHDITSTTASAAAAATNDTALSQNGDDTDHRNHNGDAHPSTPSSALPDPHGNAQLARLLLGNPFESSICHDDAMSSSSSNDKEQNSTTAIPETDNTSAQTANPDHSCEHPAAAKQQDSGAARPAALSSEEEERPIVGLRSHSRGESSSGRAVCAETTKPNAVLWEQPPPRSSSRDATLPLDDSAEKRLSSEDGPGRAISSSNGCTERDTTPARSHSGTGDEGFCGSGSGPTTRVPCDDGNDTDDAEDRYDAYVSTPRSPSPMPCPARPRAIDRTVEGKPASLSAEEDGSVVRTRLTTAGVRLSYDDEEASHTNAPVPARQTAAKEKSAAVDPKAVLPSFVADSLLMRVEVFGDSLLAEHQQFMLSDWTKTIVTRSWMPDTFDAIVGVGPEASIGSLSRHQQSLTGGGAAKQPATRSVSPTSSLRSRALVLETRRISSLDRVSAAAPPPPPPPPPAADGASSPRTAFARSPASLSFSSRSMAFTSPTLMSPRTAGAALQGFTATESVFYNDNASGQDEDLKNPSPPNDADNAAFVPMGGYGMKLKRTDSEDSLFEPPPPPRPDDGDKGGSDDNNPAAGVAEAAAGDANSGDSFESGGITGEADPQSAVSMLPTLFRMFCESGGDEALMSTYLDTYVDSCLDCHKKLISHVVFNVCYIERVAIYQLCVLELMARRHICMARDLYIRDKIELFVLLSPNAAPTTSKSIYSQVKEGLTNFRKKLLLAAEEMKAAEAEKKLWARIEKEGSKAPLPPPPPLSASVSEPGSASLKDLRAAGAAARRARSLSLQASGDLPRRPAESRDKMRYATKNPITVKDKHPARGNPNRKQSASSAATRRTSKTRQPSYAMRRRSNSPLRLPSIEVQARGAPVLRRREYVAPNESEAAKAKVHLTPRDDDFMDLANCKEFTGV